MRSTQNLILNEEREQSRLLSHVHCSQDLIRKAEAMLGVSDSGDLIQGMSYTVIGKLKEQRKVAKVTLVLGAWEAAATLWAVRVKEEKWC